MGEKDKSKRLPRLLISVKEAESMFNKAIEKGKGILSRGRISDREVLKRKQILSMWHKANIEFLNNIFDNTSVSEEYNSNIRISINQITIQPYLEEVTSEYITRLQTIKEYLDLIPIEAQNETLEDSLSKELKSFGDDALQAPNNYEKHFLDRNSRDIFIVHGHDEEAKQTIARFIEKLDLNAIILHERPGPGSITIMEKIEKYSNVCFAIVIITPDDIGHLKNKPEDAKPRARQNVIFELGYFIGKLGRNKVCALYKEGVEIPTDYHGVIYIPIDKGQGWKITLAKEIQSSGLSVDFNKVLS
jgi:predicted nucleotide-binding protein